MLVFKISRSLHQINEETCKGKEVLVKLTAKANEIFICPQFMLFRRQTNTFILSNTCMSVEIAGIISTSSYMKQEQTATSTLFGIQIMFYDHLKLSKLFEYEMLKMFIF